MILVLIIDVSSGAEGLVRCETTEQAARLHKAVDYEDSNTFTYELPDYVCTSPDTVAAILEGEGDDYPGTLNDVAAALTAGTVTQAPFTAVLGG